MLPCHRVRAALLFGFAPIPALPAQSLPAPVGTGPLLCLTTNSRSEGHPEVTLHVAELAGEGPARPIWRNRDNAQVLARLDQQHLLLASFGNPYALLVLDLAAGKHRVLADGAPHEFVALHGDAVLHLGDRRGETRTEAVWAASDSFLYHTPWRDPAARRRLCEQRFDRIARVAGNLALAVTPDDTAVWVVSLVNASGRALWTAPANAHSTGVAMSPGGQRVAIGCVLPDAKGLLTVVDLASGAIVRSWPDLPIHVSPLSSFRPTLEFGWHDDEHVVCSLTRGDARGLAGNFAFVRYSLATGEVIDEEIYSGLELRHRAPPAPGPAPTTPPTPPAAFKAELDGDTTRVVRVGAKEPLAVFPRATARYDNWRIAADGQSAIVHPVATPTRCTLFTAARPTGRTLLEQAAYDFVWLPTVTASTSDATK